MDQYKVHNGAKVNLSEVFDKIQEYIANNIGKRLNIFPVQYGVIGDGLQPSKLSDTTISILAGMAVLENKEVIILSNDISVNLTTLPTFTSGISYTLLLKYKQELTELAEAVNGFYYDNTVTKYTKYLDSYEIVLKETNGLVIETDETPICKFFAGAGNTINSGSIFYDVRVFFKINTNLLDTDEILVKSKPYIIDETYTFNDIIASGIYYNSFSLTNNENDLILQPTNLNGKFFIKDKNGNNLLSIDTNNNDISINVDTVNNPTSKVTINSNTVVNGTLKVGNREVLLQSLSTIAPPAPLNFRIVDIHTPKKGLRLTDEVIVDFEWGYNDLTGTGLIDGYFLINNYSYKANNYFPVNYFEDYYLYIPSLAESFLIEASEATGNSVAGKTKIRVKSLTGDTYPDLSSIVILSSNERAIIHSNAEYYDIYSTKVVNSVPIKSTTEVQSQVATGSPAFQTKSISLEPEQTYAFKLKAVGDNKKETTVDLEPGDFLKYGLHHSYGNPTLITHPNIPSNNASLTLTLTGNEIKGTITGYNEANYFEYVLGNADAFNLGSAIGAKITNRSFAFHTQQTGNVSISIRPYIGGQVVGAPITSTLTISSGVSVVQDVPLYTIPIAHNTIIGTCTYVDNNTVTIESMKTPASSLNSTAISYPYSSLIGDILRDSSGNEFIINNLLSTSTVGKYTLILTKAAGTTSNPASGTWTGYIGTNSKRARLIQSIPVHSKLIITKIAFDLDALYTLTNATDATKYITLRLYKASKEAERVVLKIGADVDYITISDLSANQVEIDGSLNAETLVIDLYDEFDTNYQTINLHGVFGTLFIYGHYASNTTNNVINIKSGVALD